jgi:diguanylate cyclase (GGDEF)-like protein
MNPTDPEPPDTLRARGRDPGDRAARARAAIETIWERRKDEIIGRVAILEEAATALLSGGLDDDLREQAQRDAHKLAGSLGTFGFARGSQLARDVEELLPSTRVPGQGDPLRISEAVVALRGELEGSPNLKRGLEAEIDDGVSRMLFVGDDSEFLEELTVAAAGAGLRVVSGGPAGAGAVSDEERPSVALIDVERTGVDEDTLRLLEKLDHLDPPVPSLVLTSRLDLAERVEMVNRGARGFLAGSIRPAEAVEAAVQLLERARSADTKVLAVDDDPTILSILRELLEAEGARFTGLDDPHRVLELLPEVAPDLLILDLDMPEFGGTELCRLVRSDPRWAGLPVLFLTAHSDPDTARRIFESGADDYVGKPVVGPELVTRINNRLDRIRLYRHLAETDPLTGVANRRKSSEAIEQLARLAERYHQPLGLAVIDLDDFKSVNDRHGHAAGDAVLRRLGRLLVQTFRGEDVVGRWGGEEFVVGMYGMTRNNGVQRLAEVLEAFRQEEFDAEGRRFHVTFSAGIAQYPNDGSDLQQLYRVADEALYKAKSSGRDRVLPAGWRETEGEEAADIVVVDDDAALSELLTHALETRGFTTKVISDGEEAVATLMRGVWGMKVVVLDVDLPGLNGLAVLRRLAEAGLLGRARVIMLTARSGEREVLEALELGAFDHVAKPFSIPVLIQRIRRAIGG